ncbi:MAG: DUF1592 domain-containing protein [Planctomycetes bacterium]|nr:DUF1592 domain-containing protein [Planctomycetota bacterium]
MRGIARLLIAWGWLAPILATARSADELPAAARFREKVQPILDTYCYGCHGYGTSEGGRTLDAFASDEAMLADRALWWAVLKNVRAGVMPPAGEERPNDDQRRQLFDWIKFDALGIDPANPDPGRVTLRRLNRSEYRNTIRDLMGVDFNTSDEFPADDSGYGFDNIGDVLTVSPLLMEKYLEAAERIVDDAVPQKPPHPKDSFRNKKYRRVFPKGPAPDNAAEREAYAREILAAFARRTYRRPVDEQMVERLVEIAKATYAAPGESFEAGIADAMTAVLASPRFLFRVEELAAASPEEKFPLIDEHALASRLSYFLWSSMPDDELFELADRGELRANLQAQIERMLKHRRSGELAGNFAGQWLRSRDVERFEVDLRFGHDLAESMSRETEAYFEHIVREDRSVLELIDSNYTFLDARLAEHYGIEGVKGRRMRRVELPEGNPRGGVLTQGTLLVVTSNPTRTSPVKRGLFILDDILGTPPPPPPKNVPLLEDAAKSIDDHKPTVRELQELHRKDPLCHSCHARMDPLGLALENFDMLGKWREKEHDQPIDPSGALLTGEHFDDVRQLKSILKTERRLDVYRCLTEKLLTYALGRGLDYHDEHTVDQIVERLDCEQGKFSALLTGIVESAPFQRQRRDP